MNFAFVISKEEAQKLMRSNATDFSSLRQMEEMQMQPIHLHRNLEAKEKKLSLF